MVAAVGSTIHGNKRGRATNYVRTTTENKENMKEELCAGKKPNEVFIDNVIETGGDPVDGIRNLKAAQNGSTADKKNIPKKTEIGQCCGPSAVSDVASME